MRDELEFGVYMLSMAHHVPLLPLTSMQHDARCSLGPFRLGLIPPQPLLCTAGWLKIDVAALSDAQTGTFFPLTTAAPEIPFATDVTNVAAA